jgi:hypothetical protein
MAAGAADAVSLGPDLAERTRCVDRQGGTGGVLMADRHTDSTRRKLRVLPDGLWIAAGTIVLVGFILRPLGSYFGRELRYTGIAVIALGLVLAVIAWLGERWSQAKSRK